MDLGIAGKWALVGGASKGLGWGCAAALAAEGVNVVMVARGAEALQAAAKSLAQQHPSVNIVPAGPGAPTLPPPPVPVSVGSDGRKLHIGQGQAPPSAPVKLMLFSASVMATSPDPPGMEE